MVFNLKELDFEDIFCYPCYILCRFGQGPFPKIAGKSLAIFLNIHYPWKQWPLKPLYKPHQSTLCIIAPPPPSPTHTHCQTLYKPHQSKLCINAPTHEKSNRLKLCIVFPATRQQRCHRICLTLLQNLHHLQILVQSKISFLLFSSNSCISTQFLARTQGQYIHRSLPIGDKQKLVLSSL